jgi:short-subunit dehydrogenase
MKQVMMNYKETYKNKVAWVTGASSGIGEHTAYLLSAMGAKLILSARNEIQLMRVAENCKPGTLIKILKMDLNDQESLPAKCNEAWDSFGHIDYLFNIAGIGQRDFALKTDMSVDRKIMQTNYFGTVEISKLVIARMIQQGGGHVIVTSSLSGKYGIPLLSAYSASKHALHGFFESIRGEIFKDNIRITIVIPGLIRTEIIRNALTGEGNLYGKNLDIQEKGLPAAECADRLLKAVAKGKEEVFIGGSEGTSLLLNRLFPGLFSGIMRNHPVKKLRNLKSSLFFRKKQNG